MVPCYNFNLKWCWQVCYFLLVSHAFIVYAIQAPPDPPLFQVTATTTSALHLRWTIQADDVNPIQELFVYYKREFGDWEESSVSPRSDTFILDHLSCGTRYQLFSTARNSFGESNATDVIASTTKGAAPVAPPREKSLRESSTSITVNLAAWGDGGCPILYFVIEFKPRSQTDWLMVSNNVNGHKKHYDIVDLQPDVLYNLRVTAYNSAGSTVVEYDFDTRTKVDPGPLINLLNPLPTFTETVYEAEISVDQPLNSTIITVKARDRDVKSDSTFYGDDLLYLLIHETTEDHYEAIAQKKISMPTNDTIESWVSRYLSRDYGKIKKRKYLSINSDTGSVYLKKPLDVVRIGRITAKVLIVDFRDPIVKEIVTVVVNVKAIPAPSNVAVDSVSDSSARVCWSSTGPVVDGFIVEFKAIADGSRHIHNVPASARRTLCTSVDVIAGSDHELWVYGHNNGVAGLTSDKVLFTANKQKQIVCETGVYEPAGIYQEAPPGTHVTIVRARVRTGSTHITYRLTTGNDTFSINETTGHLTTSGTISKSIGDVYCVSVLVTSGTELATCPLTVRVTPFNTASLKFTQNVYLANIPYYHPLGTTIKTVEAKHTNSDIYNNEIRYILREYYITLYGQPEPRHSINVIPPLEDEKWLADELIEIYTEEDNKYLTIDQHSGAVSLKQSLSYQVDRIYAKVLVIDGGFPKQYHSSHVKIHVRSVGPPLNVTVSNVTQASARVCWHQPLMYSHSKGYTVQVQAYEDGPVKNHTVHVDSKVHSEEPVCTYVGLEKGFKHRLWVFGFTEHTNGWRSDQILINIKDGKISVYPCQTKN